MPKESVKSRNIPAESSGSDSTTLRFLSLGDGMGTARRLEVYHVEGDGMTTCRTGRGLTRDGLLLSGFNWGGNDVMVAVTYLPSEHCLTFSPVSR